MSVRRRVLICNERFLARFGVDRILVLLAEHLVNEGVQVEFACLRSERDKISRISGHIDEISVPEGLDLAAAEAFVAEHVLTSWGEKGPPDLLVTGGWPFFSLAAKASTAGVRSLFIDAGAVPHDGFPETMLPVQLELRRLRQRTLPSIDTILPISEFIRLSQTEPDRGSSRGVRTVLLGADHMDRQLSRDGQKASEEQALLNTIVERKRDGAALILALGRFEEVGYKNSPSVFHIFRALKNAIPYAHLLLLTGPDSVDLPPDLAASITVLPTISDAALQEAMSSCALGLSVSLWEGFNLPIAEMQWLGRPTLAFNVGAHPEVIANPWFLCESDAEMTRKAIEILAPRSNIMASLAQCFDSFRERFVWSHTLAEWTKEIIRQTDRPSAALIGDGRRLVLMDVSNSARDPANSGVIRVTRRLASELGKRPDLDVVFVTWDDHLRSYVLPSIDQQRFLSSNGGPSNWLGTVAHHLGQGQNIETILRAADPSCSKAPVLLLPEVVLDGTATVRMAWARARGYKTSCIFYDMLPIYEAQYVDHSVSAAFPAYIDAVGSADSMWSISDFSQREFERYSFERDKPLPESREAVWLPGQFSNKLRPNTASPTSECVHILCVSTLEPRKNHRVLLDAFQIVRRRRPDLQLHLHLVGNSYVGAEALAEAVQKAARDDRSIHWHRILTDTALAEEYQRAAFTVYPSLAEGFGLPIMESLWMGKPCICHESGVMAELAADGGCLTVNMQNVHELAAAIETLARDPRLRESLTRQAMSRHIDTWRSYADAIANRLQNV